MSLILPKPDSMFGMIQQVLNLELNQTFKNDSLNRNTLYAIQHSLINRLEELLNQECTLALEPIAVTFLVRKLMLSITMTTSDGQKLVIAENQQLRDTVEGMFASQVNISSVPRRDLEILLKICQGSTFQDEFQKALNSR